MTAELKGRTAITGLGVTEQGRIYGFCCANCAQLDGVEELQDRV